MRDHEKKGGKEVLREKSSPYAFADTRPRRLICPFDDEPLPVEPESET